MKSTNEIVITKIPLEAFIDTLLDVYNDGAEYIDIIAKCNSDQDSVGIHVKEAYFIPSLTHKLSQEDINLLL